MVSATPIQGTSRRASEDEPQYEIKSDKTEHVAMHKGGSLHKIGKEVQRRPSASYDFAG